MKKIQARWYHRGRIKPIRLIVMHSMEAPEKPTTAENVANWFATSSPKTSTHVCVDNNSIVRCVDDGDTAWCAPNANADGLHIELTGYARQSRAEWLDAFSLATLRNAAKVAAAWVTKYNIPIRHLTPSEVRAGRKGFCAHVDVTKAYPGTGSHTDPGKGFPWDRFFALVREELDGKPAKPVAWSRPLVYVKGKPYMKGADVEAWQARLDGLGYDVDVDGLYGPGSTAATKKFQAAAGLLVTGTVDKTTWAKASEKAAAKK
ncbi:peptidoglycan recognition protein family protein [Planomonospora algeriensis]